MAHRHHSVKRTLVVNPSGFSKGNTVELEKDKSKHLTKVIRLKNGDNVYLTDGFGKLYSSTLEVKDNFTSLSINECIQTSPKPLDLELWICLPKNTTMDGLVEKAVECGATKIVPIISSRTVIKIDPTKIKKVIERWQRIMDYAVEQSERVWRPEISEPILWKDFVSQRSKSKFLNTAFISELRSENPKSIGQSFESLGEVYKDEIKPTGILIGPEGGFSTKELEDIRIKSFLELSLGEIVHRVETATVAALTLVRTSLSCFSR